MKTQLNCLYFSISHLGFKFYLGSANIPNINWVVYKINESINFNGILWINNIRITGREGFASLFHYRTYVRNISLQHEHFYIKCFETKITWSVGILTVLIGTL